MNRIEKQKTERLTKGPDRFSADVIVIGAGVAGLACAGELEKAGLSTLVLEARDRIGGRILTHRSSDFKWPIELGAEFIHGRPPETLSLIHSAGFVRTDFRIYLRAICLSLHFI